MKLAFFRAKPIDRDLSSIGLISGIFIVTRFILLAFGVGPDINHLYNHYQYLDLHLLRTDLLGSLPLLHSQPPLWNGILGLLLKISGGSDSGFLVAYSFFSFFLSLGAALLIFLSLRRLKAPRATSTGASCFYIIATSAFFYEAYIFYPMFSAFLVIALFCSIAYGFSSVRRSVRLGCALLACLSLLLLSLTWTLFHFSFVIITCVAILWFAMACGNHENRTPSRKRWPTFLFFALVIGLLSLVVPLKNKLLFGHFGTGTWMGMNLVQVAPSPPEACNFGSLTKKELGASRKLTQFTESTNHPAINSLAKKSQQPGGFQIAGGNTNFNHIGYIVRSNYCQTEALRLIGQDPAGYVEGRGRNFLYSNTLLSDNYLFHPVGIGKGAPVRYLADLRNNIYLPITLKTGDKRHLAPLLLPLGLVAGAFIFCSSPNFRRTLPPGAQESIIAGFWIMIWLYFIGHLFNGAEQNRMRFTIEPLFIAWASLFGCQLVMLLRRPRSIKSSGLE